MRRNRSVSRRRSPKYVALSHTFRRHFFTYIVVVLVGSLLFFASLFWVAKYYPNKFVRENDLLELPSKEVAKIPSDVKKKLQQEKTPPSLPATIRVPILMYHYVEYIQDKKDTIRQSLNITPNTFESQVMTLQNAGYTFMTAKELGDVLDGKVPLPPKPILLTFDDGHWDFATVVLPILEKYHVKATAYIISGFLGGSDFMRPAELENVIHSGLVDVGAHTVNHLALKGLLLPLVTTEVTQSKSDLESTYHIHVVSFAYPSGSFDQQAINVVEKAGFTTAMSTIPGIEQSQLNRFFLYRLRPGYRTGQDLLTYLNQETFRPW